MTECKITNLKHTTESQKSIRREHKHNTKEIIKPQKEKKNNKEKIQNQLENKDKNGNKYISINNYLNCQWIKCCNQKTMSGRSD